MVIFTAEIADADGTFSVAWTAEPGEWVYAVVHEPLIAGELDADLEAWVLEKAAGMVEGLSLIHI